MGSKHISIPDMADIITRFKTHRANGIGIMEACEAIGLEFAREPNTIYALIRRMQPTTDIAEAYLKSQALRLAMRVVRKANPTEAIDILSRKSIGVIAPKTEESGGVGGFFLSVQADSCGAVKVGVMTSTSMPPVPTLPQLSPAPPPQPDVIEVPYERQQQGHVRPLGAINQKQQQALDAAKARIKKAQRRARREQKYTKIRGVQTSDEQSEGPESVEV